MIRLARAALFAACVAAGVSIGFAVLIWYTSDMPKIMIFGG